MAIFGHKMALKRVKMEKNPKSKKQVLFVFQNFSFMPNFKKIWTNGEEFYILEGFFWRFSLYGISYTFSAFRENTVYGEGHKNLTVESWEVVQPFLEIRNIDLWHMWK